MVNQVSDRQVDSVIGTTQEAQPRGRGLRNHKLSGKRNRSPKAFARDVMRYGIVTVATSENACQSLSLMHPYGCSPAADDRLDARLSDKKRERLDKRNVGRDSGVRKFKTKVRGNSCKDGGDKGGGVDDMEKEITHCTLEPCFPYPRVALRDAGRTGIYICMSCSVLFRSLSRAESCKY